MFNVKATPNIMIFKNAVWMRSLTFWIVIELMFWVLFFFTYIAIIFLKLIFSIVTKYERMFTWSVNCKMWDSVVYIKSSVNSQSPQGNIYLLLESQPDTRVWTEATAP